MDIIILDLGAAIKGECTLDGYKDKINLMAYNHGVSQPITGEPGNQKRTSGRPVHQELVITKLMDLASCVLVDYCNQAKPIADVKIVVGQENAGVMNPYMTIEAKDCVVSHHSTGAGGGGVPTETVSFNYSSISWTYKPQNKSVSTAGQDAAKWNLATNKAE
jgi:type VI secretion system secreted protein Hcp